MKQNKLDIKVGQFWLVENGGVALVISRNSDDAFTLVNKVDSSGFIKDVRVFDESFEKRIGADVAKETAMKILRKKVDSLFDL